MPSENVPETGCDSPPISTADLPLDGIQTVPVEIVEPLEHPTTTPLPAVEPDRPQLNTAIPQSTTREQHPDVLLLGEFAYPPLRIREEADPQHPDIELTDPIDFEYLVYLTAFQESFNARWQEGERSYGRLNPMYYYGGTDREANISFTLPAITVQESEQNLRKCSELSRAVYGRYREWTLAEDGTKDFTMIGHRYFRVDFGNLIMNERAFISAFTFTVNPDAGVFDYDNGSPNPVHGSTQGQVLPRQIDIQISLIFRHDYPLGFGGPNRSEGSNEWASNEGRDFPHGSGIDVQPYMSYTRGTTTTVRTAAQALYIGNSEWHEVQNAPAIAAYEAQAAAEVSAEVSAHEADNAAYADAAYECDISGGTYDTTAETCTPIIVPEATP
jgi:hypothetical protein